MSDVTENLIPRVRMPINRFGVPEAGELIYAEPIRQSLLFEAATFVVAKCRTLFAEGGKLFLFKKDGDVFCTIEGPTEGEADGDGWYTMDIIDFLGSDLEGAPVRFDDGNDFTCWGPDPADETGGTLLFMVNGKVIIPS